MGTPFWELDLEKGLLMLQHAVNTHIITSRYGVPLMVKRNAGLIVEITDGDMLGYRGTSFTISRRFRRFVWPTPWRWAYATVA